VRVVPPRRVRSDREPLLHRYEHCFFPLVREVVWFSLPFRLIDSIPLRMYVREPFSLPARLEELRRRLVNALYKLDRVVHAATARHPGLRIAGDAHLMIKLLDEARSIASLLVIFPCPRSPAFDLALIDSGEPHVNRVRHDNLPCTEGAVSRTSRDVGVAVPAVFPPPRVPPEPLRVNASRVAPKALRPPHGCGWDTLSRHNLSNEIELVSKFLLWDRKDSL